MSTLPYKSYCAVIDIGKTNIKLSLLDRYSGELKLSAKAANSVVTSGDYPCVDTEYIWDWLKARLRDWARDYWIESIGITTHGATLACVAGDALVLPIMDYEYAGLDELRDEYRTLRPVFEETHSPDLPFGLNLGIQLYWLQKHFPDTFEKTQYFLMYPQYWAFRLSGRAVSEVTSLGCHTDLWDPNAVAYSTLVDSQGWLERFPPMCDAGASLGPIRQALARELGLPSHCKIFNGIHDSNASLVPHLLMQNTPFAVVSSGTWTIIAGIGSSTSVLDESKDMLANVNAFGEPTSCIRFMGGREWQALAGTEDASEKDLVALMQRGVFALPSFSDQGGPFRTCPGQITGVGSQPLTESEKTALATIYLALMTDYCLELLQQHAAVIVEGAFASNPWLLRFLASLRPQQQVLYSDDVTGTTSGIARLSHQATAGNWPYQLYSVEGLPALGSAIQSYKQKWQSLLTR